MFLAGDETLRQWLLDARDDGEERRLLVMAETYCLKSDYEESCMKQERRGD